MFRFSYVVVRHVRPHRYSALGRLSFLCALLPGYLAALLWAPLGMVVFLAVWAGLYGLFLHAADIEAARRNGDYPGV